NGKGVFAEASIPPPPIRTSVRCGRPAHRNGLKGLSGDEGIKRRNMGLGNISPTGGRHTLERLCDCVRIFGEVVPMPEHIIAGAPIRMHVVIPRFTETDSRIRDRLANPPNERSEALL